MSDIKKEKPNIDTSHLCDKTYQKLKDFNADLLDLIQIGCRWILKKVAAGETSHYFEMKAQEVFDAIFQIKEDRLFGQI